MGQIRSAHVGRGTSPPNPWLLALASGSLAVVVLLGAILIADTDTGNGASVPCADEVIYPAVLGATELADDPPTTTIATAGRGTPCVPLD